MSGKSAEVLVSSLQRAQLILSLRAIAWEKRGGDPLPAEAHGSLKNSSRGDAEVQPSVQSFASLEIEFMVLPCKFAWMGGGARDSPFDRIIPSGTFFFICW